MKTTGPQCNKHPKAKMKKCQRPPDTANRELVHYNGSYVRVCDLFDYFQCPKCKVHYSWRKP